MGGGFKSSMFRGHICFSAILNITLRLLDERL